jgi:hypothetical protein
MPRSRYRAIVGGDDLLIGWDTNTTLLADISDALVVLLKGLSGGKATSKDLAPRPKVRDEVEDNHRAKTIADFNVAWFLGQL